MHQSVYETQKLNICLCISLNLDHLLKIDTDENCIENSYGVYLSSVFAGFIYFILK